MIIENRDQNRDFFENRTETMSQFLEQVWLDSNTVSPLVERQWAQ